MFSDHLQKIDRSSGRNLFVIAGALVILCQLVAMAIVADGQVKKAELRESQMTSQRVALAQCFENTFGSARSSCMREVYNNETPGYAKGRPDNNLMAYDRAYDRSAVRAPVQGVMAVSFAAN